MPQTPSMSAASPGTALPASALTTQDYQQLFAMSMSPDDAVRAQASALAKKLTPTEAQAFHDVQQQQQPPTSKTVSVAGVPVTVAGERPRVDANIVGNDQGAGLAPEDALMGGMAARGVARAAGEGAGVVGKTVAGVRNVVSQAAPLVKYEATKTILEKMGVPSSMATVAAMALSGYSQSAKSAESLPAKPAPREIPPIPEGIGRPKGESTLDFTRRLKAENQAAHAAVGEAPVETPRASAPPAPNTAPSGAPTGRPLGQALQQLATKGLSPAETNQALALLKQGVTPEAAEAQILAGRAPSAASVAPTPAAAPAPSPVQQAVNIRPGVPPSPTQIDSALGIAARRAKVTLTAEDVAALKPLIQQGVTPEAAIQQLPALKLQQLPGVLTPEQVAAEIAARKGNRSPTR